MLCTIKGRLIGCILIFCIHTNMMAQQSLNVVKTFEAQKPDLSEVDVISSSRSAQEVRRTTQYVDGFGRPSQVITRQVSPSQTDLVEWHTYDTWGREVQKQLPFVDLTTDGNYKTNASQQQLAFNQQLFPGENNFYYSQVDLENSPANRVLKSYPAGNSWVGSSRGTQVQLLVNTGTDNVKIWNISNTVQGSVPSYAGTYTGGLLFKAITTNEQGKQAIEYKDRDGHIVLKKVQLTAATDNGSGSDHAGWLCTYYVYDDYGNLRFILSPKAVTLIDGSWSVSQTIADELCIRYEYDSRNHMVIKKTPGSGEQWFVYDQRSRMVMSQDANQRNSHKWQYYQYDNLDRTIATGLITDPTYYANLLYHINNAANSISYPNLSTAVDVVVLCETYYDDYSWISGSGYNLNFDQSDYISQYFYTSGAAAFPYPDMTNYNDYSCRGQVTGSKTKIFGSNAMPYVYSASYYDNKGRVIQTQSTNLTGQTDITTIQYSWAGVPLRKLEKQVKGGVNAQTHRVLTKMNYDHAGRLLNITKTINSVIGGNPLNSPEKTIASYTYDELGQVTTKSLGTHPSLGTPLETLGFTYNVQGWMTGINKDYTQAGNTAHVFGMELAYDKTNSVTGTASYLRSYFNGNVAGVTWKSKGDGIPRKYDLNYDAADRLTNAMYNQNTSGSTWNSTDMNYSVYGAGSSDPGFPDGTITYDANGNIVTMSQRGFKLGNPTASIDCLNYEYENSGVSNRLKYVNDNCSDPGSMLGDFKQPAVNKSAANWKDYDYDGNGNIKADYNRNITSITYNEILNLPLIINISGKGTIIYYYDAVGNKLQKSVQENNVVVRYNGIDYTTNILTITSYYGSFVYQSKTYTNPALTALNRTESLLYIETEEGRARIAVPQYGAQFYAFDYYVRDHQGNVRVTLTDEAQQDTYPAATLESGGIASEQTYYNIVNDASHVIDVSTLAWYPYASGNSYQNNNGVPAPPDPTVNRGSTSTKLYKLNGATGDRFGLGISMKVMAGDVINIFGKSVWHDNGATTNNTTYVLNDVINAFLNAFAGTNSVTNGSKGTATGGALQGNSNTTGPLSTIFTSTPTPGGQTPKGYINWILFDEQFKPVAGGNGYDPVNGTADVVKPHSITGINIAKSGYLYIYCSNESNQDVYFDNLQVVHNRGQLIEEKHYYPAGLTMFAISNRASGKLQTNFGYQGKDLQSGEFYDGSGLEEYDFAARYYDPQIGRWWVPDPAEQFASPYMAMGNHWVNFRDPNGKWFGLDDIIVSAIGFVFGYVSYGITQGDWGGKALLTGLASAAIAEVGYLTLGGGLAATGQGVTAATGQAGTMAAAKSFGGAFALSDLFSVASHYDQLKNSSDWGALGLISGYSFTAALSAGFNSDYTATKIDNFFGVDRVNQNIKSLLFDRGAAAAGWGGFFSGIGNRLLDSYDPVNNKWNATWGILGRALYIDYLGSYIGKSIESSMFVDNSSMQFKPEIWELGSNSKIKNWVYSQIPAGVNGLFTAGYRLLWERVIFHGK
jgi:RHS repeat-associated protein